MGGREHAVEDHGDVGKELADDVESTCDIDMLTRCQSVSQSALQRIVRLALVILQG